MLDTILVALFALDALCFTVVIADHVRWTRLRRRTCASLAEVAMRRDLRFHLLRRQREREIHHSGRLLT
jgi:hypothetical protein